MGLARRATAKSASYRTGYLQSAVWWQRRHGFLTALAAVGAVVCTSCAAPLTPQSAHLHHITYRGVTQLPDGRWHSGESDDDLVPLCRDCHTEVHDLFDRFPAWRTLTREGANAMAFAMIRERLLQGELVTPAPPLPDPDTLF